MKKIANVATLQLATRRLKKSQKKYREKLTHSSSRDFFSVMFSAVLLPVQGWLHLRFLSRAGDPAKFEKISSPACAKNRSSAGSEKAREEEEEEEEEESIFDPRNSYARLPRIEISLFLSCFFLFLEFTDSTLLYILVNSFAD